MPQLVEAVTKRYQFVSNNSTDHSDLKENGLKFEGGFWEGRVIKKLSFSTSISFLDGQVSTEDSKALLIEILEWTRETMGTNYSPSLISRWAFVSDIIIQSDFPLLFGQNPVLISIADKIANAVAINLGEKLDFQPSSLTVGHDPQKRSSVIAPFSINHRANSLYEENIFFAEAPVPTSLHLELLEELESAFRNTYEGR